jgi:hypothetical protein
MYTRKINTILLIIIVGFVLLLASCINNYYPSTSSNRDTLGAPTRSLDANVSTKGSIIGQTSLATQLLIPSTTPTITAVLQPTITIKPIISPSLEPTEKASQLKKMIETNGGCKLPCWWGFYPGITKWRVAEPILKSISDRVDKEVSGKYILMGAITATRTSQGSIRLVQDYVIDQNDTIQYIKISSGALYKVYPLNVLLSKNGKPDEIWMITYTTQNKNTPEPFEIYLLYLEQRFLAVYQFSDVKLDSQNIIGCGKDVPANNLWMWKTENFATLSDVNNFFNANFELYAFQKIQDVSNLNPAAFTTLFTSPDSKGCIVTPQKNWHQNDRP